MTLETRIENLEKQQDSILQMVSDFHSAAIGLKADAEEIQKGLASLKEIHTMKLEEVIENVLKLASRASGISNRIEKMENLIQK